MKLKTMAMTGVMSLAGLGLIGAGAHATFTQNTTSQQQITAGTPQVVLSSADASNGCTTIAIAEANPGPCSGTLTLNPPAVGWIDV
jgi:predicted ribosomally synthesized peptide with SipW-like signal peptide